MAFWTTQRWKKEQGSKGLVRDAEGNILLVDKLRLRQGACELTLGPQYIIGDEKPTISTLSPNGMLSISPGEIAMLLTDEVLHIPPNIFALISIRSTYKLQGLINISGFHADPGFRGRIKYCVYNAGGHVIHLKRGSPIFSIWLSQLSDDTCDPYNGDARDQLSMSENDLRLMAAEVVSPKTLHKRISALESELKAMRDHVRFIDQWWFRLVASIILIVIGYLIKSYFK